MFKHRSLTPTAISSRFSNWSYHDLGHAFGVFGAKDKADAGVADKADDEVAPTSDHNAQVDAKQWTTGRKVLHLLVIYHVVFLCSLAITTILPKDEHNEDEPEPNLILSNVPYAAFLIGMSVGWLLGSPVISLHRRRWPTITMTACFVAAQLAVGLSSGLILVSCFRAVAGMFASIVMSLCLASTQDMFVDRITVPYLVMVLISGVASSFGPSYEYLLSSKIHHRWTSILIMFALFPFILCTFFMHDTAPAHGSVRDDVSNNGLWRKIAAYARLAIGRPIYVLFTNPSIIILSLSAGFNTALCYAIYLSLPSILATAFNQTQLEFSLSTFSLAVGYVVAFCILIVYNVVRARIDASSDSQHQRRHDDIEAFVMPKAKESAPQLPDDIMDFINNGKRKPSEQEDEGVKVGRKDDDNDKESKKSDQDSDKASSHRDSRDSNSSNSSNNSDSRSSISSSSRVTSHYAKRPAKKPKRRLSTPHQTRWFWPMLPIVVLMPLGLAFFAFTTKAAYAIFAPLAFLLIFSTCAFSSLVCGYLFIYEKFAGSDHQSSAVAIYMFVVSGMGAGLCVVITHLLKSMDLKALFGIFAGVVAGSSLVVLFLWLRLRRA